MALMRLRLFKIFKDIYPKLEATFGNVFGNVIFGTSYFMPLLVVWFIYDVLRDLVPFVQFKT